MNENQSSNSEQGYTREVQIVLERPRPEVRTEKKGPPKVIPAPSDSVILSAATRPITDSIQSRYGEETRVVVSMERRGAIKLLGTFDDYGEDHAAVTERIGEMLGDVFADLELS